MSRLIRSGDLGRALSPTATVTVDNGAGSTPGAPPSCPSCNKHEQMLGDAQQRLSAQVDEIHRLEQQLAEQAEQLTALQQAVAAYEAQAGTAEALSPIASELAALEPQLPAGDLVRLLKACLENLAGERAFSDEQVKALVMRVVAHVRPLARVTVSVSAADYALIHGVLAENFANEAGSYVVTMDESLECGDVLVATDIGDWDGRLSSRVDALMSALEGS